MYLERNQGERNSWKYFFKGSELLENTKILFEKEKINLENKRTELTKLLEDRTVAINSKVIDDLKNETEKLAESVERLSVFVVCFQREPDRSFILNASDVVFFGCNQTIPNTIKLGPHDQIKLNNQLYEAAKTNNLELCKSLIQQGADFNETMYYAAYSGHINAIKLMIQHGANNFNKTMFSAAIYGHIDIVRLMIECGANNFNEVLAARKLNNLEIIKLMIQYGATDFNTAMCNAAYDGYFGIVQLMVQHGAKNFDEAIRLACNEEIISFLKNMKEKYINN